jgi:hypothetical protein
MSSLNGGEIFPYRLALAPSAKRFFLLQDIGPKWRIQLNAALDKALREADPKISRVEVSHRFFYAFVSKASGLYSNYLRSRFMEYDHDDERRPTFDETYSEELIVVQRHLVDQIEKAVQSQSRLPAGIHFIQNLLEESGVNRLLARHSPGLFLSNSLSEEALAKYRREGKGIFDSEFQKLLGNLEHILAKYQIRQKGLKLRHNSALLARLTYEIRKRTAVYDAQDPVRIQEVQGSEHTEKEFNHRRHRPQKECRKRSRKSESGRIWKHFTISRDETSASDFVHKRIVILFLRTEYSKTAPIEPNKNNMRDIEDTGISKHPQQTKSHDTRPQLYFQFDQHSAHPAPPDRFLQEDHKHTTNEEISMGAMGEDGSSPRVSTPEADSYRIRQLASRVTSLELENKRLKAEGTTYKNWKIIHFIATSAFDEPTGYFDKPVMAPGLKHHDFALRAFLPVTDVGTYVKRTGLDFVVSRFYSVPSLQGQVRSALAKKQPPPEPMHYSEHIQLQSQQMLEAMQEFLSLQDGFWEKFPDFDPRAPIPAPYIFWYTYRSTDVLEQLQPRNQDLMRMLTLWVEENYAKKYAEADSHFERGVVTLRTMPFLACPGDVLIWKEKQDNKPAMKAAVTCSLLSQTSSPILYWDSSQFMWSDDKPESGTKKGEFSTTWSAKAWSFKFTGEFFRERKSIELKFKASSLDQEIKIAKLAMYPLRFADENTRLQLETRGRTFWGCRVRNLVSYTGNEGIFTVCEELFHEIKAWLTIRATER